ncbi:hypothetical protein NMY22_g14455 [Coprinellus aureogranulatus]|nr:hypothetical protein NMY22_g14455 [Coprinellus aureogranulatus]
MTNGWPLRHRPAPPHLSFRRPPAPIVIDAISKALSQKSRQTAPSDATKPVNTTATRLSRRRRSGDFTPQSNGILGCIHRREGIRARKEGQGNERAMEICEESGKCGKREYWDGGTTMEANLSFMNSHYGCQSPRAFVCQPQTFEEVSTVSITSNKRSYPISDSYSAKSLDALNDSMEVDVDEGPLLWAYERVCGLEVTKGKSLAFVYSILNRTNLISPSHWRSTAIATSFDALQIRNPSHTPRTLPGHRTHNGEPAYIVRYKRTLHRLLDIGV